MGKQKRRSGQRGAAEEQSGVPLTEAEMRANQRPPGNPQSQPADMATEDSAGMAGGASGSSGGGASTSGHPDNRS